MDLYLDANATTPVLAQARAAALAAMEDNFGNPSSVHGTGLKARALMQAVRSRARRVLGVEGGRLLFVSGATEGIQTAVLSALSSLRGRSQARWLLYGATEHKAVPETLAHWNRLLGLDLQLQAIPVGRDGRHDLEWLREHAPASALVCTMAANNETGVITDLEGVAEALAGSGALWMVDGVQALGKMPLHLERLGVDYSPFSGHKLYAPKGIGLLYVRDGAPFTPLMAGGGQEDALRSGTENMAGIAALGAVLAALEDGSTFRDSATLAGYRDRLASELVDAFPGLVFNAPLALCLPTTLNFAVPGLSSKLLLNLFDAADVRVSAGSACSAARAEPSHVLVAMGLPEWQTASAVRLSFGPAVDAEFIDAACARIRACGAALRACTASADVTDAMSLSSAQDGSDLIAFAGGEDESGLDGLGADAQATVEVEVELEPAELQTLAQAHADLRLVDVRELYERHLSHAPLLGAPVASESVPLSRLAGLLPQWLALPSETPVVFFCRSGNRSAIAARALRRLGHERAWSLTGGLALWPVCT